MKYIQSGGGYYFKVYKNGKKKRISEKEYKQKGGYEKPSKEKIREVIDDNNLENMKPGEVFSQGFILNNSIRNILKYDGVYIVIYEEGKKKKIYGI